MGGICGGVGWVAWLSRALLNLPAGHVVTARQRLLFLAVPCIVSMGIAMLFPLWRRYVKIHSLLLQSIIFWLVVPVVLLIGHALLLGGFSFVSELRPSLHLLFLLIGAFVAGICFYLIGKLLNYSAYS